MKLTKLIPPFTTFLKLLPVFCTYDMLYKLFEAVFIFKRNSNIVRTLTQHEKKFVA